MSGEVADGPRHHSYNHQYPNNGQYYGHGQYPEDGQYEGDGHPLAHLVLDNRSSSESGYHTSNTGDQQGDHRNYSDHRNFSDHMEYSDHRNYSDHNDYSDHREGTDRSVGGCEGCDEVFVTETEETPLNILNKSHFPSQQHGYKYHF